MLTAQQRQYQLDHNHVFFATVKRTRQRFKFGFCNDTTKNVQQTEHIHGFWSGTTGREIETVETVDINSQDVIELDKFGFGKVISSQTVWLNPLELRFVPESRASKVTKIVVSAIGG